MERYRPLTQRQGLSQKEISKLNSRFPEGSFLSVGIDDVPLATLAKLEFYAGQFTKDGTHQPGSFTRLFSITYPDSTISYAASVIKTFDTYADREEKDEALYIEDLTPDGQRIGFGQIVAPLTPDFQHIEIPFVGRNYNLEGFTKHGFGTRRLFLMNALSVVFYRQPLQSGLANEHAIALWEKLVRNGEAVPVPPKNPKNISKKFVFI